MFLTTDGCSLKTIPSQYSRIIGDKEYELKDHLGNIRVTLSDARENSTTAKVTSATSYLPFGMVEPNVFTSAGNHRFGFGGMEKDDEWKGDGNSLDFGGFGYDPRVARRWNREPLIHKLSNLSSYVIFNNSPILYSDPSGLFPFRITIRSFHPNKSFGSFFGSGGFHGDNRGFSISTAKEITARITQSYTFDVAKNSMKNNGTWSNESVDSDGNKATANPSGEVSKIYKKGNSAKFNSNYSGNNPLVKGSPDIDINAYFEVNEDLKNNTLTINTTMYGDDFPNTEAMITDASGKSLFIGVDVRKKGNDNPPLILVGGATTEIIKSSFTITLDKQGNFQSVSQNGKIFTTEDWNKKYEKTDAAPSDKK